MKNELVLDNYGVYTLSNLEEVKIDAGYVNPVAVGVAIYLIAEDWSNIKKGAIDAMKEYFS